MARVTVHVETATTPALYPTRVTHLHRSPVHHYAEHRSYSWYVDVDELPRLPWWLRPFARFEGADHFTGGPNETLRQRVDGFLASQGVFLPGGRITALLLPRVLGRAFNPLSLFWCHDVAGALRCVVAEVQSTRGDRIAYLVPPGEDGPVPVVGALRASGVRGDDGYFLVRVPRPGEKLDLTVSQHRDNHLARRPPSGDNRPDPVDATRSPVGPAHDGVQHAIPGARTAPARDTRITPPDLSGAGSHPADRNCPHRGGRLDR